MATIDVVEIQARLADGLQNSPTLRDQCQAALAFAGYQLDLEELFTSQAVLLSRAESYHVSTDMVRLIDSAAAQLLSSESFTLGFEAWEMPDPEGFAVFELPVKVMVGDHEHWLSVSAISWAPHMGKVNDVTAGREYSVPGIRFSLYAVGPDVDAWAAQEAKSNDSAIERTVRKGIGTAVHLTREMIELLGHAAAEQEMDLDEAVQWWMDKALAEPREIYTEAMRQFLWIIPDYELQAFSVSKRQQYYETRERALQSAIQGMDLWRTIHQDALPERMRGLFDGMTLVDAYTAPRIAVECNQRTLGLMDPGATRAMCVSALMWTFFHMTRQTITSRVEERSPRPTARRWKRMPMPKRVTVVTLRHTSHGEPLVGDRNVEWSHRWIVKGHWRNQACGPGRSERRQVYIAPHVKGPEGKPLQVPKKVYDLRR